MKLIDSYSYQCGVIDCFNEMVRAGLKKNCFKSSICFYRGEK